MSSMNLSLSPLHCDCSLLIAGKPAERCCSVVRFSLLISFVKTVRLNSLEAGILFY